MENSVQVKLDKNEGCRRVVHIKVPAEKMAAKYEEIKKEISKTAKVAGFRAGKVPENIIDKVYGPSIKDETMRKMLADAYSESLDKLDAKPITEPIVSNISYEKGKELAFTAEFDVMPEFKLPELAGLKINRKNYSVTEKDIDHAINDILERNATFSDITDRGAAEKDVIVINYAVSAGSKVIDKKDNIWLTLDEKSLLPGMYENVKGMKPGEEKEIDIKLPEDYFKKEFAGAQAGIKVNLVSVKAKNIPALNGDFIKKMGAFEDVRKFKDAVREDIESFKKKEREDGVRSQIFEYLIKNTDIGLPQMVFQKMKGKNIDNSINMLKYRGLKEEDINKEKAKIEEATASDTEKNMKIAYIFHKIVKDHSLDATDEDINGKIKEISRANPQKEEEIKKYYSSEE
ncbi:MAG: trigger factor, partial [Candidatus Aureabacteria bacterium]|nr:trigger factor [Candidatus Auribacterota bacterium]